MPAVPEIAVVDTHALIWWLCGDARRLGKTARSFTQRVDAGMAVACVPAIALVELSEAVARGRVTLFEPFDAFVRRLDSTPSRYQVVPLSAGVVRRAHDLFAVPERGDRLIAATAQELGVPLVTRDPALARAIGERAVW